MLGLKLNLVSKRGHRKEHLLHELLSMYMLKSYIWVFMENHFGYICVVISLWISHMTVALVNITLLVTKLCYLWWLIYIILFSLQTFTTQSQASQSGGLQRTYCRKYFQFNSSLSGFVIHYKNLKHTVRNTVRTARHIFRYIIGVQNVFYYAKVFSNQGCSSI